MNRALASLVLGSLLMGSGSVAAETAVLSGRLKELHASMQRAQVASDAERGAALDVVNRQADALARAVAADPSTASAEALARFAKETPGFDAPFVVTRAKDALRYAALNPAQRTAAADKTRRLDDLLAARAAANAVRPAATVVPPPPTNVGGPSWQAGFSAGWARGDKKGFFDRRHDKDYTPPQSVAVPAGHDANFRSGFIAGFHSGYIVGYSRGRQQAPRAIAAK